MLQYGRHERYSSTVQFIFCTCFPRREPRDNTVQIIFSFENHSLFLSSLQVQQKAVAFLPSVWRCSRRTKAFGNQMSAERAFAMLFQFLQRYMVLSSMCRSSAVLAHPPNFFSGSQNDIYCGGHSCVWVLDCCYPEVVLQFLCPPLRCCSTLMCWQCPFEGRKRSRKGEDFSSELGRNFILV